MFIENWSYVTLAGLALAGSVYWLQWRWKHRRLLQLAALVPGPPALPIIGNALMFLTKPAELLNAIGQLIQTYGEYMRFWLGPELNICVNNPDDIRLILTSNKVNQKGPLYDFLKPIIGPGVLSGGPSWRNHRKIANASYSKKSVHYFCEVFNHEAEILAEKLSRKMSGVTFNIYFDVVNCTTQSVCQTLMGLSKEDSKKVNRMDELVLVTQDIYALMFKKMTHWWLQIPFCYWLSGHAKKQASYQRLVDDVTSDMLAKARHNLAHNRKDEDTFGIIDRFLMSNELTDQEIKWETFTLFTTSQEASAKITSAVLLFLAYLPNWQEKVYNEILEVLGPTDQFVSEQDLKKLKYLDMVYKEALRYMSIAAFIQRTVEEELILENGKITLPVGATVIIPIHVLHRDSRYWQDPHKVDPGRFLPENVKKRNPNAFVPFSLGVMDCLGRVYATALIKTIIVKALRKICLETEVSPEDLELNVAISVKFSKGYNLKIYPRNPTDSIVNQR